MSSTRSQIHVEIVFHSTKARPLDPYLPEGWRTEEIPANLLTFPGGEPHCSVGAGFRGGEEVQAALGDVNVLVTARLADAEGFVRLLAVLDAIRSQRPRWLGLAIPYFPGARQDHPEPGTPFTARLYANAIMQAGAPDRVLVVDPHSNVLRALLGDRMDWISTPRILPTGLKDYGDYQGVIAPDAGATKRAVLAAAELGTPAFVQATKVRDPHTGALSLTSCPDLLPGRWLVVDDICDGGGTFVRLADAIKQKQAAEQRPEAERSTLDLFVSHGIFSKGVAALAPWFERIITTDSLPLREAHPQLHVVSLRSAIEKWAFHVAAR